MAEIHIEKKKRPVWPWILGLLIIAGLAWVIIEASTKDKKPVAYEEGYFPEKEYSAPADTSAAASEQEGELGMTPGDTSAISKEKTQALLSYVNESEFEEGMGRNHEVTAEGLIRLSEAIQEVSNDAYSSEVSKLQQTAEEIRQDPQALQNSGEVRNVLSEAAETIGKIQEDQFPELKNQVSEIERSAESIKANEQLPNQSEQVKDFFEKAASALNDMSEAEIEKEPS